MLTFPFSEYKLEWGVGEDQFGMFFLMTPTYIRNFPCCWITESSPERQHSDIVSRIFAGETLLNLSLTFFFLLSNNKNASKYTLKSTPAFYITHRDALCLQEIHYRYQKTVFCMTRDLCALLSPFILKEMSTLHRHSLIPFPFGAVMFILPSIKRLFCRKVSRPPKS